MLAILCALMSGGTIVFNRMLNADLGTKLGLWPSTVINYITGLFTSIFLMIALGSWLIGPLPSEWYLYTGGLIGVAVVMLSSAAAPHLPVFLMTLLVFVAQLVTGMILDAMAGRATPVHKVLGALVVLGGLVVYVVGEHRATKEEDA